MNTGNEEKTKLVFPSVLGRGDVSKMTDIPSINKRLEINCIGEELFVYK